MTVLNAPVAQVDERRPQFGLRDLSFHWVLACLLLLALIPILGTDAVLSADVGAQMAQSDRLANGNGWYFPTPLPEVAPKGQWFAFHLSAVTEDSQYVVLAKHPVFTMIVAKIIPFGGLAAVMALATLATTITALGAGLLVGRSVSARAGVAAFWIVAALSPVTFQGFLGYAHSTAAAIGIMGFLAASIQIESGALRHWGLPLAAVLFFAGPFFRSEATPLGLAVGLALVGAALLWPSVGQRRLAVVGGLAVLAATLLGTVLDKVLTIPAASSVTPFDTEQANGWLAERISAIQFSWFGASGGTIRPIDCLLLITASTWFLGGRIIGKHHRTSNERTMDASQGLSYSTEGSILLVVGAATAVLWAFLKNQHAITGLFLAFPILLLLVGLAIPTLSFSKWKRNPTQSTAFVAFAIYFVAVTLSQHSSGGAIGWGGRYYVVGISLAVVGLGSGLSVLVDTTRSSLVRYAIVPALASLVLISSGFNNIRTTKLRTELFVGEIAAAVEDSSEGEETFVVTTLGVIARVAWQEVDTTRWLLVDASDVPAVLDRLDNDGRRRVLLVGSSQEELDLSGTTFEEQDPRYPWPDSAINVRQLTNE